MKESEICDKFSVDTKREMFSLVNRSLNEKVEYSAALTPDLTLKGVSKGTVLAVDYPKIEGAVGTFHTHVLPEPPSSSDFLGAMARGETVVCIGARKRGDVVSCYELDKDDPMYEKLGVVAKQVSGEGAIFEEKVIKKYGKIPERVTELDDEDYEVYLDVLDRVEELEVEFEKVRDDLVIASCEIR